MKDSDIDFKKSEQNSVPIENSKNISAAETERSEEISPEISIAEELQEQKDKYLRLYAEFENYKKRVLKDKEELLKYGNESLLYELLPVVDNLEMALKHAKSDPSSQDNSLITSLIHGVEITLKEFMKVIEKFGVSIITAADKPFDPSVHHAMSQVERDDVDENTVIEEFRRGYMLKDKVLRPSLVSVSKKPTEKQSNSDSQK